MDSHDLSPYIDHIQDFPQVGIGFKDISPLLENSAAMAKAKAQLLEIVETKKNDLNARDPEMAAQMIAGTARSMGLQVVD